MLHLYFTRHGETEWNAQNRMQGHLDSNLTAKGVEDALLLGEKLVSTEFEAVISSPSLRTIQTSKLIMGDRGLPFKTDERLREIHLGSWQGKTIEEIQEIDSHRYDCYVHHPDLFTRGTGENFQDVKVRLESFLESIEDTYSSGNLLIVTHGMVIKTLQMICKQNPIDRIWEDPWIEGTSLTVVRIDKRNRDLLIEGDISHKKSVMK